MKNFLTVRVTAAVQSGTQRVANIGCCMIRQHMPACLACTILAVALTVLGCAGTSSRSYSYLDRVLPPLSDTVNVPVIPSGMPLPNAPYILVGEVYVQRAAPTVWSHVDRQQLVDELRRDARRMGADAVVSMLSGNSGVTFRQVDQAWFWGIAILRVDRWIDRAATEQRRQQIEDEARLRLARSKA